MKVQHVAAEMEPKVSVKAAILPERVAEPDLKCDIPEQSNTPMLSSAAVAELRNGLEDIQAGSLALLTAVVAEPSASLDLEDIQADLSEAEVVAGQGYDAVS